VWTMPQARSHLRSIRSDEDIPIPPTGNEANAAMEESGEGERSRNLWPLMKLPSARKEQMSMRKVKTSHEKCNDTSPLPRLIKEQYLILIECRDEREQIRLLERLLQEGVICRALLS
jgi:hypothetical protein